MILNQLAETLGISIYHLMSYLLYYVQFMLAMLLFARSYQKQKLYYLRLIGCILAGLFAVLLISRLRTDIPDSISPRLLLFRCLSYASLSVVIFLFLLLCYREKAFDLAICWATIGAATGVYTNLQYILIVAAGNDPLNSMSVFPTGNWLWDLLIHYMCLIAYLIAISFVFVRRPRFHANENDNTVVLMLCITVILVDDVILNIARPFESQQATLALILRIAVLACFLLALGLLLGLLKWNRLGTELAVTEQLLLREKRYYQQSRANVEAINRMIHDLKHRLTDIDDKLNAEQVKDLRRAMAMYDANIKTGNEVLDTILYEKQIYCTQNGVRFSCMADGQLLSFLSPSHLYALFSNAIDNATEAVLKLDDPESRLVCVNVAKNNQNAEIVIYNYYVPEPVVSGTSKPDRNHHGYGLASIRAIAEQYGGSVSISTDGGIFTVTVLLPLRP